MPKMVTEMPKGKPEKAAKTQKLPKQKDIKKIKEKEVARPVKFPTIITLEKWLGGQDGPITCDDAKEWLQWETEEDFKKRKMEEPEFQRLTAEQKKVAEAKLFWGEGEWTLMLGKEFGKELSGTKIRCWNSDRNRPFDETHCMKLAQTTLNRQFAGPTTMQELQKFTYDPDGPSIELADRTINPGDEIELPEGTVNGETISIGRSGLIGSGNHRLIGLVLANMLWEIQKQHWESLWPTPPVLESLVVFGVSESAKVVQTLDNVKPRSASDVIYTSDEFRDISSTERKECSRMLAAAIDLLWKRTEASNIDQWNKYMTNATTMAFLDRHPKLRQCVRLIFDLNRDRAISLLKLSAGQSAACLYLMGSSDTDIDVYRNADPFPSEKKCKWGNWKEAVAFWASLSSKDDDFGNVVKKALGNLKDSEDGTGGRLKEKLAVLAHAWVQMCGGDAVTEDSLNLDQWWSENALGARVFMDKSSFGGIDVGNKPPVLKEGDSDTVSPKKVEEEKKRVRQEAEEKERQEQKLQMLKDQKAKREAAKAGTGLDDLASRAAANSGKGANGKPLTSKQVQEVQTAKAIADDERELQEAEEAALANGTVAEIEPIGEESVSQADDDEEVIDYSEDGLGTEEEPGIE